MGKIIKKDDAGHVVYEGLLSSEELATADALLELLMDEIPKIERELDEKFNSKSIMYKYNLGKRLGGYLEEHKIYDRERKYFWDEIKLFATDDESHKDRSSKRQFYEQCYMLSQLDLKTVNKLSWRQWQDLLDRPKNRADDRIFAWITQIHSKIREDDWREFEKALHQYLGNKDTAVFSDNELFDLNNSILLMCVTWRVLFADFAKTHPKSDKIKNKSAWSKKYYAKCFEKRRARKCTINKTLCTEAFKEVVEAKILFRPLSICSRILEVATTANGLK